MWNFIWNRFFGRFLRWLFGTDKTTNNVRMKREKTGSAGQIDYEIAGEDKYFELLNVNQKAKQKGNYQEAIRAAVQAIPYLEDVENVDRKNLTWSLQEVSIYLPVISEGQGELQRIKQEISPNPKVDDKWVKKIDHAIDDAGLMQKMIEFLEENPGFPQSKLWQELDVDGRKWAPRLKYAEQVGVIRRERNGDSKLYAETEVSLDDWR